jgi:PAS domain S-box-containing protein
MKATRFIAAALQRLVDRIDPHEGRYRMLFEESPLAMWVSDARTLRFLAANEAALRLYGYTREEFLRMSADDIRVKKDGAPIEIETVSHQVIWRGHAAQLVFIQDVTERRRVERALQDSEQRFSRAFHASPMPLSLVEVETGRYVDVNEPYCRMVGHAREMLLGRTVHEAQVWADEAERSRIAREVVRAGQVQSVVGRMRRSSGELREIRVSASLLPLEHGTPRTMVSVFEDITERLQAERLRERAQAELERLNRELEDRVRSRTAQLVAANNELEAFSYSVSHDLRAPVRHIDGFVKLLEREFPPPTEKATHYLRTIAASSRRMGTLIDDLLALSRTARAPLEMRKVALRALLEEVLRDLRPDTAQRAIDWRIGSLPAVRGDPSLLRVVLHNLLANAVKYTRRQRAAIIEVGLERMDSGEAAVFVRDNGVGFDMSNADRLFGVFQRLHRDEEFEGTGIGLATARRIVHRHGGRIWGEGDPERGALFRFTVELAGEGG